MVFVEFAPTWLASSMPEIWRRDLLVEQDLQDLLSTGASRLPSAALRLHLIRGRLRLLKSSTKIKIRALNAENLLLFKICLKNEDLLLFYKICLKFVEKLLICLKNADNLLFCLKFLGFPPFFTQLYPL